MTCVLLHYLSTVRTVSVSIEETNGVFQRRLAQVHVHLGRRQVLVPGQSHYGQLELRAGKWLVRVVPRGAGPPATRSRIQDADPPRRLSMSYRAGATGHRVPEGIGAAQGFFHRSWSHSQLWGRSRMLVS
jgi:hypothetical protein